MTQYQDGKYLPEEELIDRKQNDPDFTWVDYVTHHSAEWEDEYTLFCASRNMPMNDDTALAYITYRQNLEDEAVANGNM